jgi:hypothetical protein
VANPPGIPRLGTLTAAGIKSSSCSSFKLLGEGLEPREPRVSVEASDVITIPRAELDALKAELRRLRRQVGRGVAIGRIEADPGPGDTTPTFTRDELAAAWGISE